MSISAICFGHETAFQILRTTSPLKRASFRGGLQFLPVKTPTAAELQQRIELLRTAHADILIDMPAHLLMAKASRRRPSTACKPHVCSSLIRGRPFEGLGDRTFVSTAAFSFLLAAAQEKNMASLLELGYELCGSYQTPKTGVPLDYQVKPLTCTRALHDFASHNQSLHGAGKVLSCLRYVADGSASPRETKQAIVMGLPMMYGGYGLGIPHMNFKVETSPAAQALTGKASFRCDLCWPEAKLDVEYQSRERHSGEAQRIRDSRRTNALIAMGWTVVSVTGNELNSLAATDAIANTIRRYLGKRSQVRIANYHAKKLKLRRQLGLPLGYD